MATFNLAETLKNASAQMGTNGERLERIDINLIDADPLNFYAMSGIDELMANIELVGLQQPIRLRRNPDAPGRYIPISGHRRWTAFCNLAAEGKDEYKSIPAIVEEGAASAEMQELRLIYANASTRKLTDYELRKQAERVEELLYKLKEQGVDFPGRMRDHVAEACKVSKSKLARLKQIADGLAPDIREEYWAKGKLQESTAVTLAKMNEGIQRQVIDFVKARKNADLSKFSEGTASAIGGDFDRFAKMECPAAEGKPCCNGDNCVSKLYARGYRGYDHCRGGCCYDCDQLATCSKSCQRMAQKKAKLKAEAKEQKAAEKAAEKEAEARREECDTELINFNLRLWARMAKICAEAGKDYRELCANAGDRRYWQDKEMLAGTAAVVDRYTGTPIDNLAAGDLLAICKMADALGVSVDYLLCRTDAPTVSAPAESKWHTGDPPRDGEYLIKYDADEFGGNGVEVDYWENGAWEWTVGAVNLRWCKIPEE